MNILDLLNPVQEAPKASAAQNDYFREQKLHRPNYRHSDSTLYMSDYTPQLSLKEPPDLKDEQIVRDFLVRATLESPELNEYSRVSKTAPKRPKMFFCPVEGCTQGFTRKQNLKSHLGCHSSERPHVCPECPAAFRRRQEMLRHARSIHGGEDSIICKCVVCDKAFYRIDAFYRHLESKRSMHAGCVKYAAQSLKNKPS